jgi:hypothetical protein
MHNTTFFRIVALILVPVLVAGSLFFIFRVKPQESDSPQNGTTPNVQIEVATDPTDPDFTVPDIQTPTDPHDPVDPDDPTEGDHILTPEKPGTEEDNTEPTEPDPTEPAETNPVEPEKPTEPPVVGDDNEGGISIGGGTVPYDCDTEGHHCDGPETHAYILNLELKGCKYCGSHSCPSFYAVDEWGNTCYDPSQCPKYDVHEDPVHYCQECGKACGDGSNGTCVQFVSACHCPNCGEPVDRRTCHSCEEE